MIFLKWHVRKSHYSALEQDITNPKKTSNRSWFADFSSSFHRIFPYMVWPSCDYKLYQCFYKNIQLLHVLFLLNHQKLIFFILILIQKADMHKFTWYLPSVWFKHTHCSIITDILCQKWVFFVHFQEKRLVFWSCNKNW